MHGNVWEWLWDMATSGAPYPAGPAIDPLGPASGGRRRDRGGSYHNHPAHCRSANRDSLAPDSTLADTGFRLARSAP
jgi:formylglycine-generating enzyme required for sulfatase activity